MKRGLALSIVLSCVLMVAGCSYITIVNLYPVQGPLRLWLRRRTIN